MVCINIGCSTLDRCDQFVDGLAKVIAELDEPPLLLISSDMNHFATDIETRRLAELALAELDRLNEDKLFQVCRDQDISMCGHIAKGDQSRVVGHAGMWFV